MSRVLNGSPAVREETRQRVLAAIAELSYAPNPAARALSTGRTLSIGVVAPFFTRPSVMERLRGVARVLAAAGLPAGAVRRRAARPGLAVVPDAAGRVRRPAVDLACPPDADLAASRRPACRSSSSTTRTARSRRLHRRRRGRAPGDRASAGARPPADRVHRRLRAEPARVHVERDAAQRLREGARRRRLRRGARARAARGARARAGGGPHGRAARLGAAADRDLRGLRHPGARRAGGGGGARGRACPETSRSSATTTSSWLATRVSPPSHSRSRRAALAARRCCWPRSRARPPAGSGFPSSWSCAPREATSRRHGSPPASTPGAQEGTFLTKPTDRGGARVQETSVPALHGTRLRSLRRRVRRG